MTVFCVLCRQYMQTTRALHIDFGTDTLSVSELQYWNPNLNYKHTNNLNPINPNCNMTKKLYPTKHIYHNHS